LSAIGHRVVFRLARWSWRIRTGFLGPRATWDPLPAAPCILSTGPTPSPVRYSNLFDYARAPTAPVRQNRYGKSRYPGHATPAGYHTWHGLAFVRVRSPLLTESLLSSLPAGTEMFHFPAFPPRALCVQAAVTAHDMRRGFPIRTSWDHGPVIDSPRLIADSHVLHRLPMPRHPPCALKNLATNGQQFPRIKTSYENCFSIRCSRPLCSSQTTTPSHPAAAASLPRRPWACPGTVKQTFPPRTGNPEGNPVPQAVLLPQDPTVCQRPDPAPYRPVPAGANRRTGNAPGRDIRP
jgi:hypothetical protein